ncbi:hypothetical protein Q31b_14940 [Novipirellula aureliae]|uniref:DUF4384 domain-containing protein n=1 Tax=Novipirellula aureliae TaxID=2527966 RepID=A0A5C6E532_9BACT|nr:hypothetical protein [Novipirellula aureliae]TWU43960.1 hypothetical protein Q31b_14940 [Novipirellula aureliae]
MNRLNFLLCLIVCLLVPSSEAAYGEPITTLPPGLVVEQSGASPWNRIVLIATPRIASGDVDAMGRSIRDAVAKFRLTIMTQVNRDPQSSKYTLVNTGVGYSTMINSQLVVIDSANATDLGASLGFIERRVLGENEEQCKQVQVIVRTTTLFLFDVPAIFDRFNQHRRVVNRHLVWINPTNGKLSLATWLFDKKDGRNRLLVADPLRIVAENTREDRAIHVDGDQFFLGVPNENAFALEALPPGTDFSWTDPLQRLACRDSYDADLLSQLAKAINEACGSR